MENQKGFLIRTAEGEIINKVKRPAVVADIEFGVILKIGEYETMETYHNDCCKLYRDQGLHYIADDLVLLDIPKDQDEIDKIFQNTGYIKKYL